jgi:alanine racemase
VQIRDVPRGGTVGYGATWTASRPSRIAIVSVGYGDGYPRATSEGRASAVAAARNARMASARPVAWPGPGGFVAGRRCPIAGRISMDLMALDVTGLPEETVRWGDHATLIGGGITVDDVAAWSGTIGYEVLTRLGRRHQREWVE